MYVYGKVVELILANTNDRIYLKDKEAVDLLEEYQAWADNTIDLLDTSFKINLESVRSSAEILHQELQSELKDKYIINLINTAG